MTIILFIFLFLAIIALVIWVRNLKKSINKSYQIIHNLQYEAGHDGLTGLVNSSMAYDRLVQSIKNAKRYDYKVAVLYLELTYFKQLNNISGFDISNELLEVIAQKLSDITRKEDTVARVDGNEFVILLENFKNTHEIEPTIENIMNIPKKMLKIKHHHIQVIFNLGISVYPDDKADAYTLFSHAYTAMNMTKGKGFSRYLFYTPELFEEAFKNEKKEHELVDSLNNNEIQIYYQLQVDGKNNTRVGMEAYIRWIHPLRGVMSAGELIHLAEEIGYIVYLDQWVIKTSINQFQAWNKAGLNPGKLFINLSTLTLMQGDFIAVIKLLIEADDSIKEFLCFEINETQLMKHPGAIMEKLNELHSLGIELIVDNFGSHFSSLVYLERLPVKTLRIGSSFILRFKQNENIIKTMIAIAKNMQMDIIAEGVETSEQRDFLLQEGCSKFQGFLYHKPEPAKEIIKRLVHTKI